MIGSLRGMVAGALALAALTGVGCTMSQHVSDQPQCKKPQDKLPQAAAIHAATALESNIPRLDRAAPKVLATATFAMG